MIVEAMRNHLHQSPVETDSSSSINIISIMETNVIILIIIRDIERCNFCGESLEFYDNVAR